MIAAKRACLRQAPAALRSCIEDNLHLHAIDVLDPGLAGWLCEALEGARRPVVVSEGLLGYFGRPEKLRVASSISKALQRAGGGTFVCDIRTRKAGTGVRIAAGVLYGLIRLVTVGRGVGSDFEDDAAIHRFFEEAGFESAKIADSSAAVPHLAEIQSVSATWSARVGAARASQARS